MDTSDAQSKLLAMGLPMKIVSAMNKSELGHKIAAGCILAKSKV